MPNAESRGPGVSRTLGGRRRRRRAAAPVWRRCGAAARVAEWPADRATGACRSIPTTGRSAARTATCGPIAVDGSNPVRVTTDAATDWNPVWSPDGRLAVLSERSARQHEPVARGDRRSDRSDARRAAAADGTRLAYVRHFSLSADGSIGTFATHDGDEQLARAPFDPQAGTVSGPVESLDVWTTRLSSRSTSSPDGREAVVQTSFRTQEDLYLMRRRRQQA